MKKLISILIVIVFLFTITSTSLYLWYKKGTEPVGFPEQSHTFIVEPGDSTANVLEDLKAKNLISNIWVAKIYLKLNPSLIQAGKFSINTSMNLQEIFEKLALAEDETVWVTIPEGLRYDEIAIIWSENLEESIYEDFIFLAENKLVSRDTAEGYLFPDTYNIKVDSTAEDVFNLMYNNFQNKVGEINYNTLILASIVEREAITDEERPIVAGILKKRLDTNGWLLQADATLLYESKDWTTPITVKMKESKSLYNSYYNPDLPPTPICNPGLKSIEAARNPKTNTEYWFYLHGKDGQIRYAVTQDQHIQNINNYLR